MAAIASEINNNKENQTLMSAANIPTLKQSKEEFLWDKDINQIKAYKEFQEKKRASNALALEERTKNFTPNTKEKNNAASVEAYRLWKEEEQKRLRLEKIEKFKKDKKEGVKEQEQAQSQEQEQAQEQAQDQEEEEEEEEAPRASASTAFLKEIMQEGVIGTALALRAAPTMQAMPGMVNDDVEEENDVQNLNNTECEDEDENEDEDDGPLEQSVQDNSNMLFAQINESLSAASIPGSAEKEPVWPTAISDNLTQNQMPDLPDDDDIILAQVVATNKIIVRVVTWNQQAKSVQLSPEELARKLFQKNKFHIVAVGTEECENTIAKSILNTSKAKWEGMVAASLGEKYAKIRSHTLQATNLLIYCHRAVLPILSGIDSCAISTGFAATSNASQSLTLGNKGGIGISFNVGKSR